MSTYSFQDVNVSILGIGIGMTLGGASGVEDITIAMTEDKNTMTIGADGGGMHSLHAGNAGTVTIRLLKGNPYNSNLSAAYDIQKASSANWGKNTITVTNSARGDIAFAAGAAFRRQPDFTNAKDGGFVEWVFDAIQVQEFLGSGSPNVI